MIAVKTVYIRVVSESEAGGMEELTRVLLDLLKSMPGASLSRPVEPHPRGGFSLFLDLPEAEVESAAVALREQGWLPCF